MVLNQGEQLSIKEMASRLGVSESTVRRYVKKLMSEGLVEGRGKYSLTEKGLMLRESLKKVSQITEVSTERSYVFTDPKSGVALPLRVRNLEQLYAVAKYKLVDKEILLQHIKVGYLGSWIRNVIGDDILASIVEEASKKGFCEVINVLEKYLHMLNVLRR